MSERLKDFDDRFSVRGAAHELVEKYKPAHVARGSESLVYLIDREGREYFTTVAKVSIPSIADCAYWLDEHPGATLEDYIEHASGVYEDDIENGKRALSEARDYFGADTIPSERSFFGRVPATPELLRAALTRYDEMTYNYDEIAAKVTLQYLHGHSLHPHSPSVSSSYLSPEHPSTYSGSLQHKLVHRPGEEVLTTEELEEVFFDEPFSLLIEAVQADEEKAEVARNFVRNAISYTNDTGKILDVMGENNITLATSDSPHFTIIDGIAIGDVDRIKELQDLYQQTFEGEQISNADIERSGLVIQYIRTVNALAIALGMEERLSVLNGCKNLNDHALSAKFGSSIIEVQRDLLAAERESLV